MIRRRQKTETEHSIQAQLMTELSWRLKPNIFCAAIPNGGYRRPRDRPLLMLEGVKRGSPDLYFIAPDGVSAWLEMKTATGFLSPHQKSFAAMCRRNGHRFAVAHSVDQALEIIGQWGFLR